MKKDGQYVLLKEEEYNTLKAEGKIVGRDFVIDYQVRQPNHPPTIHRSKGERESTDPTHPRTHPPTHAPTHPPTHPLQQGASPPEAVEAPVVEEEDKKATSTGKLSTHPPSHPPSHLPTDIKAYPPNQPTHHPPTHPPTHPGSSSQKTLEEDDADLFDDDDAI